MPTELYERCPICGGSGITLQEGRANTGAVIHRGAACPACDRGFVPSGWTVPDVMKKRTRGRNTIRARRARKEA